MLLLPRVFLLVIKVFYKHYYIFLVNESDILKHEIIVKIVNINHLNLNDIYVYKLVTF